MDPIRTRTTIENPIGPVTAYYNVVAPSSADDVLATTTSDDIVTLLRVDNVLPRCSHDIVGVVGSHDRDGPAMTFGGAALGRR